MSKNMTDVTDKYIELKQKHDEFILRYKKFIDDNKKYLNTIPTYFLESNLNIIHKTTVNASSLVYSST
jgi:hypothetical protein